MVRLHNATRIHSRPGYRWRNRYIRGATSHFLWPHSHLRSGKRQSRDTGSPRRNIASLHSLYSWCTGVGRLRGDRRRTEGDRRTVARERTSIAPILGCTHRRTLPPVCRQCRASLQTPWGDTKQCHRSPNRRSRWASRRCLMCSLVPRDTRRLPYRGCRR